MSKTKNGQVYGKYIKIKGNHGAASCKRYIDDKTKTRLPDSESIMNNIGEDIYSISAAVKYIENDVKVINPENERHLVSGVNCYAETSVEEFKMAEESYHRHKKEKLKPGQNPNQAFHVILSYKGTELDPELVHKMGVIFAERLCKNDFQAVVATHLNTDNYHNHILINAYALDSRHKFKDEYNLYRKFREIVNGISQEYGLPVFLNGDDTNRNGIKSWKEIIESSEGQSWVADLKTDLDECIAASVTFAEVQHRMKEKGYTIHHNKRSESYSKDNYRVRDRKLGNAYTQEGIEERISRKETKEKRQRILAEIEERRKHENHNLRLKPIYIPRYYGGKRRSFLMRLILLISEAMRQGWNVGYSRHIESISPKNPVFYSTEKKEKILMECTRLAEEIGAFSENKISDFISEGYAKMNILSRELRVDSDFLDNAEDLTEAAKNYAKDIEILRENNLKYEDTIKHFSEKDVNQNVANLEPMQKKTRAALFRSLHDSLFILDRSFDEISESSAQKMIAFLNQKQMGNVSAIAENVSDTSVNHEKFFGQKNEMIREAFRFYNTLDTETVPEGLRFRYLKKKKKDTGESNSESISKNVNNTLPQEVRRAIEELNFMASYGLTSEKKVEGFLDVILKRVASVDESTSERDQIKDQVKKAHRLSYLIDLIQKPGFVYGPLYNGSTESLLMSLAALVKDNKNEEILTDLYQRLTRILERENRFFSAEDPPDPEEYRLLKALSEHFPMLSQVKCTGLDVHNALIKIEESKILEKLSQEKSKREEQSYSDYRR